LDVIHGFGGRGKPATQVGKMKMIIGFWETVDAIFCANQSNFMGKAVVGAERH
jgi:hypothetical protein